MTALRITAAAATAALLAGCMNLQPRLELPAPPVADRFPHAAPVAAPESAAAATLAAELPWREYFGADAQLAALIDQALAHNRDLRVAVHAIEVARAQLGARRADRLPTVGVGVSAVRQPGPGGDQTSTYSAGLAVSAFELDLFGRVRSLGDAAAARLAATEEARRAAQIALVASVANVHFARQADEALLALTRRTLATREQSLALTQLKFEHGAVSELELRLAQSLVESARVALAAQQRQRELDENALVLLVGRPLPEALPPPRDWERAALADVPAGLPSQVLLRRPDVRQAEGQLVAANADIGAARAAFWPRITLTGSVGTASSELGELFQRGAWTFAPQLLLPLFDAGRNQANLDAAQAQRDIALAQYERAIQSAFRDVADALAGRATIGEQLRAVQAQAEAEQRRYDLADLRFRNGITSSLELLDAQRSLFAAQQALVQTQLALLHNRVAVYRALGGGWGG